MKKLFYLLTVGIAFGFAFKALDLTKPLDHFEKTFRVKLSESNYLDFKFTPHNKKLFWSYLSITDNSYTNNITEYILLVDDNQMLKNFFRMKSKSLIYHMKERSLLPLDMKESKTGDLLDNFIVAYDYSKSLNVRDIVWVSNGRPTVGEVDARKFFQVASDGALNSKKIHTVLYGNQPNVEMLRKVSQISEGKSLADLGKLKGIMGKSVNTLKMSLCTTGQIDCLDVSKSIGNSVSIEDLNVEHKKVFTELRFVTTSGVKTFHFQ